MLLIRRFEDRVYRLFLDGEIPGTLHQYQGQEAVAAGVCDVLRATTGSPRPTARTATRSRRGSARAPRWPSCTARRPAAAAARAARCTRRSRVGMLPAIAIVGGGNTVVTGLGLAMKLRGDRPGRGVLLRRGRDERGGLPRGPQLRRGRAAADRLRLREQPLRRLDPLTGLARARCRRACEGLRRPAQIVDGMDVLAVREARHDGGRGARAPGRADAARVQDLSVHRPQPKRRARLPHPRRGGGVGRARSDRSSAAR